MTRRNTPLEVEQVEQLALIARLLPHHGESPSLISQADGITVRQFSRALFQQHRSKAEQLSLSVCFPAYPRKRTFGISARHPDADRVVHALATCVLRRAAEIPCKFNRVVRHQTVVCPS